MRVSSHVPSCIQPITTNAPSWQLLDGLLSEPQWISNTRQIESSFHHLCHFLGLNACRSRAQKRVTLEEAYGSSSEDDASSVSGIGKEALQDVPDSDCSSDASLASEAESPSPPAKKQKVCLAKGDQTTEGCSVVVFIAALHTLFQQAALGGHYLCTFTWTSLIEHQVDRSPPTCMVVGCKDNSSRVVLSSRNALGMRAIFWLVHWCVWVPVIPRLPLGSANPAGHVGPEWP